MRFRLASILACAGVILGLVAGVAVANTGVATTESATAVGHHSATLHGIVDTGAVGSAWLFEYGPTRDLGSYTPVDSIGPGTTPVAHKLQGLSSGSSYYFRLVVIQGGYIGTASFCKILSFKTTKS
jgi:hypothetical protein